MRHADIALIAEALREADEGEAAALIAQLDEGEALAMGATWGLWAHPGQYEPEGDWRTWVIMAGRGFGKTRAGAEWVSAVARADPGAGIALAAATIDEVRRVMIEGPSGLIAVARADEPVVWEPSRGRVEFASGAEAWVHSGASPERLRGPQHHYAWCDELAKWKHPGETWAMLQLGLRCGERPRAVVTTTPRPGAALKAIIAAADTVRTGGGTRANPHLPEAYLGATEAMFGGTRFGRQELDGELIEDVEGALWPRALIEACRVMPLHHAAHGPPPHELRSQGGYARIVIGVDPPAGTTGPSTSLRTGPSTSLRTGDACGIVAVGLGRDGIGYVLGDHSVSGLSPEGWARKVAAAVEMHRADRVVAEANNGGKMVESVLRGADVSLPLTLVHASQNKVARAEPVAALFEAGRAKFAGVFRELEDELAGLTSGGGYHPGSGSGTGGPGRSPDRADAMVWAMSALMLGKAAAAPAIRRL